MLRCKIFSCTCTHAWCYVVRSSLALAHTCDVTLWDLLLHTHECLRLDAIPKKWEVLDDNAWLKIWIKKLACRRAPTKVRNVVVGRLPFVRIAHAESIDCCMTGFLSLNTPTQAISLFFGLVAASRTPLGILRSNLPNNGSLYPRYSEIFFPKLMVDCTFVALY